VTKVGPRRFFDRFTSMYFPNYESAHARWEPLGGFHSRADIRHNDTKRTRYVTKENRGTQ